MSTTVLTLGGELGDDDATVYDTLDSLQFTDAASSLGSWSATIPTVGSFADELFADSYIYHDDEVLFQGELESFDTDYTDGTTTLSGRGALVTLDRETTSVTYSDTTVYEALIDAWDDTQYDANVYPPNRDFLDQTHTSERGLRQLWTYDGWSTTTIYNDDVEITPEGTLKFTDTNVTLDEGDGDNILSTIWADEDVSRLWMLLETVEPVTSMTAKVRNLEDGSFDAETVEIVSDSVSHDVPRRFHLFRFELSQDSKHFRPILENDDELIEVRRAEAFATDPDAYATIDTLELDGTKFEVLQDLHDAGAYTFNVRDFETMDVTAFPVDTVVGTPDWKVVDSTRTLDYTDYANTVTVHGKTLEDGTVNTATAQNDDEIARLNELGVGDNGVIEHFEKNTDVETQSEVASRAERLLRERVNERDESGSLEVTPTRVAPGFTYSVGNWAEAFPDGGQIGASSLYFDGDSQVLGEFGEDGGAYLTFEFLIHPQGIRDLGDDEYQTLIHYEEDTFTRGIRVYGDGRLEFDSAVTDPGIIEDGATRRLSVVWGNGVYDNRRVYVDGELAWIETEDYVTGNVYHPTAGYNFSIGADLDGSHGFVGGIDDVRLWANGDDKEEKSQEWIQEHAFKDLFEAGADLEGMVAYLRFDDFSEPDEAIIDGVGNVDPATVDGAEFQDATGQLEEVQYSLGNGDTLSLDFDISGRIDTELVRTKRTSRSNRRSL